MSELDIFLTEFKRICSSPIDEPVVEDRELLLDDIYLPNKKRFFEEKLAAYQMCIKRPRKMNQTASLTQLKELRTEQFLCHLAYIRSHEASTNEAKSAAAKLYAPLLEGFKYFRHKTNAAQSAMIQEYITAIQGEKYAEAFQALELEERTEELQTTNEEYIMLSANRADERMNMPASPSKMRHECIQAYRNLVDLLNFAQENNKYYLYDETISQLMAITQETQALINRRKNEARKEVEEGKENEEESNDEVQEEKEVA